ncbi:hypothetical protein E2C01_023554 [Portunus trituberculatus]|uniref:Uncharacterized protein n=1 Tax=Portunus trituberculatus TaxID=210409 RepID=A0A5B7EBF5_PORTR|nr:hypothetical protein [Portunus trituberculatus]
MARNRRSVLRTRLQQAASGSPGRARLSGRSALQAFLGGIELSFFSLPALLLHARLRRARNN